MFFTALVGWAVMIDIAVAETRFPKEIWQTKQPREVGLDADQLNAFAKAVGGDGVVVRDAFCSIGHRGNEVMLMVLSWKLLVAARYKWGGLRLEKTRMPAEAIGSDDSSRRRTPR